jgi:hypothetical protein
MTTSHDMHTVLRWSTDDDGAAVAALAALDSTTAPAGTVLLAEVGGEPRAALAPRGDRAFADPFEPTAELVELLRERLARDRGARLRPRRLASLRAHRSRTVATGGLAP